MRRRMLLGRVRLAVKLGLASLPLGALLNVLTAPDRLLERLSGFGLLVAAYVGIWQLTRLRSAARHARALAIGFMLMLGVGLLYLLAQSPTDLDVLGAPVICVMIGSALLFPWNAAGQMAVSTPLAAGYLLLAWPYLQAAGMRETNVALSFAIGAGISVLGATVLERSRRAAFNDRQRVRALAVQRRHLIDIGRALRGTLEVEDICTRVVAHARRLIPADAAVVALLDERTSSYRVVATDGLGLAHELREVEWGASLSEQFCTAFAPAEVRESPGGPLDDLIRPFLQATDVERILYAAVGPHPLPAAFLAWTRRHPEPFTRTQRLAAQGIADQTFTALTGAGLYATAVGASRLKAEFVSTMSHELRTPLNVIMGYSQILSEVLPPAPETTRALDAVHRAGLELLDLVEATLDLGRLEAGRETVTIEPVSLRELFDELAREFAPVPRASGVALLWEAGDVPALMIDRRKLKTVLKNLVGNALKFTPAGSVRVECRAVGGACRFRIIDTGIGIRAEHHAAVFEMFRQVDSSDARRYGGTGLGLYIVRQLVGLLGGQVTLESAPGHGSVFTITLPLRSDARLPETTKQLTAA